MIKSGKMKWVEHVALWRKLEMYTKFWLGSLKGGNQLEDLGISRRILLKWILRKYGVRMRAGINVAQDREQWQVLVNTVMNLQVPQKAGIS
jgi:hypothetical protein